MKRILAFLLTLCLLVVHPVTLRAAEQEEPEELPSTQESEEFSRALARMGQVYDPALSALTIPEALTKQPSKEYTVMIYMIGSNLESVNASATSDLTEIENSGVDYSKANLSAIPAVPGAGSLMCPVTAIPSWICHVRRKTASSPVQRPTQIWAPH